MPSIQRHPDHPDVQPKPGDTIVWRWDGSDEPLPEIPHTGSCHCVSHFAHYLFQFDVMIDF